MLLSEVGQAEKDKYHINSFHVESGEQNKWTDKIETSSCVESWPVVARTEKIFANHLSNQGDNI